MVEKCEISVKKRTEYEGIIMEITQGTRFDTLGLSPEIMRALEKKGYALSTPIQAGCIPPMLDWQDVTAKAPTGTGKTFAFGIPIIER